MTRSCPSSPSFTSTPGEPPFSSLTWGASWSFPAEQLELLRREGVTWMNMVPTQLHMLLDAAGEGSLPVKVLTGGSLLPKGLADRAWAKGVRYSLIYGGLDQLATAISALAPGTDPESTAAQEELRTWVLPLPMVEVAVRGEEGQPVPPDGKTIGEVYVESPWLPPEGYYQDPERTRESYPEGRFRSGDLAVRRTDGRIYVVDREKDAVKSGGEWIPSAVLEAVPAIAAVAILAMPDERWGERPLAVVQPQANAELRAFLEAQAQAGRIARYWIPDRFILMETIPTTSAGKLHKAALRKALGLA